MLKNNKGISLITVIVTIVIMIILISIVVSSSIDSVEETNLTKIENEIKNLKDAVSVRMANYERNKTLYPMIGEKLEGKVFEYIPTIANLESGEVSNIISKITNNYNNGNQDYYRLVGRVDAEKIGVEGIDIAHRYIVDYYECEVYGPVRFELINIGG